MAAGSEPEGGDARFGEVVAQGRPMLRNLFFRWFEIAVENAEPQSCPVLVIIDVGSQQDEAQRESMAGSIASAMAERLRSDALVAVLGRGRISLLLASDGRWDLVALHRQLHALIDGLAEAPVPTIASAIWGADGVTAEALFVVADARLHQQLPARPETGEVALPTPASAHRLNVVSRFRLAEHARTMG